MAFSNINDDTHVDLEVYSVYIQDEIEISPNFDLILGARFDSFDIDVDSFGRDNGGITFIENRTRDDDEVSPRAGLIYKPQENVSIYISYSESFQPRSGEQFANINGSKNS